MIVPTQYTARQKNANAQRNGCFSLFANAFLKPQSQHGPKTKSVVTIPCHVFDNENLNAEDKQIATIRETSEKSR